MIYTEIDRHLEKNAIVDLQDFYFNFIERAEKQGLFTAGIGSIFAVLCTDEYYDHRAVTRRSYERAKIVFKFNPLSHGVTNKILGEIYQRDARTIE